MGLAAAQGGGAEAGARPDASFPGTTFPPDQCVAVVPGPDSCGRGVRWVQWKLALGSQAEYECGGGVVAFKATSQGVYQSPGEILEGSKVPNFLTRQRP